MQWDELRVGATWLDVAPARSPIRLDPATISGGLLRLHVNTDPGSLKLQVSTNLVNWNDLLTLTSTNGTFDDAEVITNTGTRFYRFIAAP